MAAAASSCQQSQERPGRSEHAVLVQEWLLKASAHTEKLF
jgi:hypothetical protein